MADGKQPLVAQLIRLRAIGSTGAWILVKELTGCLGLAPAPCASRDSQIEQGISKASNKPVRTLLVELL